MEDMSDWCRPKEEREGVCVGVCVRAYVQALTHCEMSLHKV